MSNQDPLIPLRTKCREARQHVTDGATTLADKRRLEQEALAEVHRCEQEQTAADTLGAFKSAADAVTTARLGYDFALQAVEKAADDHSHATVAVADADEQLSAAVDRIQDAALETRAAEIQRTWALLADQVAALRRAIPDQMNLPINSIQRQLPDSVIAALNLIPERNPLTTPLNELRANMATAGADYFANRQALLRGEEIEAA